MDAFAGYSVGGKESGVGGQYPRVAGVVLAPRRGTSRQRGGSLDHSHTPLSLNESRGDSVAI